MRKGLAGLGWRDSPAGTGGETGESAAQELQAGLDAIPRDVDLPAWGAAHLLMEDLAKSAEALRRRRT